MRNFRFPGAVRRTWSAVPERLFLIFFGYTALFSLFVRPLVTAGPHPALLFLLVAAYAIVSTKFREAYPRSSPVFAYLRFGLVLAAYREMDWFTPVSKAHLLEQGWVQWDRALLDWLRPAIESAGVLIPGYLELCYALVYAVGVFSVAVLRVLDRDDVIDRWMTMYLVGTLGAYALFPFFPSDPPRVVFPMMDGPTVSTVFRKFNQFLVGGYGIHSSVFPSAHVSSALAAGLGLLWVLPDRSRWGWGLVIYSASVAVATIYGRYHYAADALAGAALAIAAAAICRYWPR